MDDFAKQLLDSIGPLTELGWDDIDQDIEDACLLLIRKHTVPREDYMQALKDLREAANLIIALNKQLDHGCQP